MSLDKLSPKDDVAEKDLAFWARPIKIGAMGLFTSIAKASISATVGKWDEVAKDSLDGLTTIGMGATPPQLAGRLLKRSMNRAVHQLLRDYFRILHREPSSELAKRMGKVAADVDRQLAEVTVELNEELFEKPREVAILPIFEEKLEYWLTHYRADQADEKGDEFNPKAIAARLGSYFVYAMHGELRDGNSTYEPLLQHIKTEVAEAWRRERHWKAYRHWFDRELDQPLFGSEDFGLRQIFVWPRAWYLEKNSVEPGERDNDEREYDDDARLMGTPKESRSVVELREALDHWLEEKNPKDAVRVISGDPGSGKSSFLRMYVQHRLNQGDHVVFIPLHLLNVKSDLAESVASYCHQIDTCPSLRIDKDSGESKLLLAFDGLDELAKQGVVGKRVAEDFVEEVCRTVAVRNTSGTRLQVIISGRPIAIQNVEPKFRQESQVLHVFPYFVSADERKGKSGRYRYSGRTELLELDQRNEWWRRYGELKGLNLEGLPEKMGSSLLDDITAQPLLNYLLALVQNEIDFERDVNRNQIYRKLLGRVWKRDWDPAQTHRSQQDVTLEEFTELLEEMALTAWHDRERLTTVAAVETRCQGTRLESVLNAYKKKCDDGVGQLFAAFYFRKSDQIKGAEETFEFTHKSFGEYLTACRIVGTLDELHQQFAEADQRRGRSIVWNEREALLAWLKVCGPATISGDLREYLDNEICLRDDLEELQATLVRLLNENLRSNMPCEELAGKTFGEMLDLSRNAEEALLVLHSCCATQTKEVSDIEWPAPNSAGTLMKRLQRQRVGSANSQALESLNHLNFLNQHLEFTDFFSANLKGANLRRARLQRAALQGANLYEARLHGADLHGANLHEAKLRGADLQGAYLQGAKLQGADLHGAKLHEAKLQWADLYEARLHGADLQRADLYEAKLRGADLQGAKLQGANLQGANLYEARLHGAKLRGADLQGADLRGADLRGAEMDDAILDDGALDDAIR